MVDQTQATPFGRPQRDTSPSLETWAVIAAGLVILCIVAGALPMIPW